MSSIRTIGRPALARGGAQRLVGCVTLVEIVVSTALLAVALVAALNTVGAAVSAAHKLDGRARAVLLAEELMNEILLLAYEDPSVPTVACGPEAGETGGNRGTFDDVDDYNEYKSSPPQDSSGAARSDLAAFAVETTVVWVSASDLTTVSNVETDVKRIEVRVSVDGLPAASLTAYRTRAWDATQ